MEEDSFGQMTHLFMGGGGEGSNPLTFVLDLSEIKSVPHPRLSVTK